ncbi:MAG: UDP-N-acetylglucosamine 2-epimerase (non-hydrolyzing) [Nitrospinae bacterium]|nr:UDP-N-acetylglucosamine 2-epimerase (non-hydrolyzing) [Nitrospinota bacterium]
MSKKLKVMTIIGTRPEAIKMFPVIKEMRRHPERIRPIVVLTGQHTEMLRQMLRFFKIKGDHNLNIMSHGQDLFDISSKIIKKIKSVLERFKPDLLLVQGDTTTVFISSLSAFYLRIPVAHIEAGLRTFNKYQPFPEEINRRLTSVLSDLHFAPTVRDKNNLVREGVSPKNIFVTGNTIVDAVFTTLKENAHKIDSLLIKMNCYNKNIILITAHRRENFGKPLQNICKALKIIAKRYPEYRVIYPVHPNPNVRNTVYSELKDISGISLTKPLSYGDFIHLMKISSLILTDSGGIQEEACVLGKPVLILREVTERPVVIDAGIGKVIGSNIEKIVAEVSRLIKKINKSKIQNLKSKIRNPFGDGMAGERIVKVILKR